VVIKRTEKKRVVEVTRKMVQGTLEQAQVLLSASHGGTVLNTAFIERLNGTIRQRLASLTRKCRHAARRLAALESGMWLLGCTSNLCWPHHELSRREADAEAQTGRSVAHSSHGQWLDRSYLEYVGTLELSCGSCALGGTETTGTPSEADRAIRQQTTTPSTLASSSERGFMLNHHLVESYHLYNYKSHKHYL